MSQITIKLNLDDGSFTSRIKGATAEVRRFDDAVDRSGRNLRRSEERVRQWGRGLRDTVITIGLARHALMNLNDMILGLPRTFIKTNAEIERMKALMMGLSSDTDGYAESNRKAGESVDFIYDMAKRAPFEVQAITDSFVKLKAAGIDPANGSLQALIDSVAKFGGTSEQLKRASIAIQQMAGKGVISMEELRQQLGEAVPNAVLLMSRALNVSMGELVDKISQGTVEASSALNAMFNQMTIENSGAALIMSDTWNGVVQRLKTRWVDLQRIIGDAGFFDEAKEQLRVFTDEFMTSVDTQAFARQLGEGLTVLVRNLAEMTRFVIQNREVIMLAAKAWLYWKTIMIAHNAAARVSLLSMGAMTVAIRAQAASIGTAALATSAWTVKQRILATTLFTLRGALTAAAVSFRALGAAMMANPIGIVVAGLLAAYEVYQRFIDKQEELKRTFQSEDTQFWSNEDFEGAKAQLQRLRDERLEHIYAIKRAELAAQKTPKNIAPRFVKQQEEAKKSAEEIKRLDGVISDLYDNLARFESRKAIEAAGQAARAVRADISREMLAARAQYVSDLEEFRRGIDTQEGLTDQKRVEAKQNKELELRNVLLDKNEDLLNQAITAETKVLKSTREGSAAYEQQIVLIEQLNEELKNINRQRQLAPGQINEVADPTGGEGSSDTYTTWINTTKEALAELGAKIQGAGTKLAEFRSRLAAGKFEGITDDEIKDAEDLARSLDTAKKKYKELTDAKTKYEQNTRRLSKLEGIIQKLQDRNATVNPWLKKQAEVKQYVVELENMRESLEKYKARLNESGDSEGLAKVNQQLVDLNNLVALANDAGVGNVVAGMNEETIRLNESLLTSTEKITAEYDRLRAQAQAWFDAQDTMTEEMIADWERYMGALGRVQARMEETPVEQLMRKWQDSTVRFQEVWANAIEGASKTLTDFLVDGEADFADFAKSIVKMIIEIAIQKQIAGLVGGLFGGAPSDVATPAAVPVTPNANGGIMTSEGPVALKKYAKGGIARSPQLALFGEGSQAEAYVPLPDGRSIPVTLDQVTEPGEKETTGEKMVGDVQVNVINQGNAADVESTESRFDGEKYIVDVVMKNMARPGPMRESMKGMR